MAERCGAVSEPRVELVDGGPAVEADLARGADAELDAIAKRGQPGFEVGGDVSAEALVRRDLGD